MTVKVYVTVVIIVPMNALWIFNKIVIMDLNVNDTCTITFGDETTARVRVVNIDHSKSGMFPSDYWFEYLEGETNRQIIHPDFGKSNFIKSELLLPEGLVAMVITKDGENKPIGAKPIDEYEQKLNEYLENNMNPENFEDGMFLFRRLEKVMTKEEIIEKYFNK
jgi:hypothetical protein